MLEDNTEDVAMMGIPVVVIFGELDKVDRVETPRRELLPRMPQASMHVLRNTVHLSPLEAPQAISQVIRNFVREISDRRSSKVI